MPANPSDVRLANTLRLLSEAAQQEQDEFIAGRIQFQRKGLRYPGFPMERALLSFDKQPTIRLNTYRRLFNLLLEVKERFEEIKAEDFM